MRYNMYRMNKYPYRDEGLLHVHNAAKINVSYTYTRSDESTHPNTLMLMTFCQLSNPAQLVPLSPTPALFMSTAT